MLPASNSPTGHLDVPVVGTSITSNPIPSAVPTASPDSLAGESSIDQIDEPGGLLHDLVRRQDDVLEQLDELDAKIRDVLKGLGATLDDDEQ